MNHLDFPRVGERMYREVLENGLHVFVFPKPEFQKSYAFFATNYGGMDLRFCLDGTWHDTPAGVAHYLEHKMFDTREGNALQKLTANGASPNAFTSNAITGYYFECTEQFEENLKTLLSFVSVPYFTQESVDKEQGIIGQEIGMPPHPPERGRVGGVHCPHHPPDLVRLPQGLLRPGQHGAVRGGESGPGAGVPDRPGDPAENGGAHRPEGLRPPGAGGGLPEPGGGFQLGCKGDAPERGEAGLRQQMLGELACEVLLGNSTPLYARLYQEGLINRNFSYGYDSVPGCAFLAAGGESRDPEAVRAAVEAEARRIEAEGVDPGLWDRVKKGVYGWRVRSLNSFETLCVNQAQNFFAGREYLRFADLFADIRKEDVEALIARWVTPARTSLSVIRPKEVG